MRGLAHQAAVLTISRIANYGLMIISPIILVRYLTVTDFGRYREFLLYASLLSTAAAFAISESLLYFIPLYPASLWRVVRETAVLLAVISLAVVGGFVIVSLLVPGGLVGPYLLPLSIYVLLFVNLDWWENLWVATRRPIPVLVYTAGRLIARMVLVVSVAVVTHSVTAIIGWLVVLEAVRFIGALIAWRAADRSRLEAPIENIRREQLRFCVPYGMASLLYLLSRNLGNLVIVRFLGAAALAQFTIGTYGEPIIMAFRNSITAVVLPELVRLGGSSNTAALRLWQRATVINCLLLLPSAVIVAWYAEPLILKAFGANYRPAIPVLQWYALVIARSCCDFSPLLRAINRTRAFLATGLIAGTANAITLALLLPLTGIVGAAVALAVSNLIEVLCLGYSVSHLYGSGLRELLPWRALTKVAVCVVGAAAVAFGATFAWRDSILGAVGGSILYVAVFMTLVLAARVEEATVVVQRLKPLVPALFRR